MSFTSKWLEFSFNRDGGDMRAYPVTCVTERYAPSRNVTHMFICSHLTWFPLLLHHSMLVQVTASFFHRCVHVLVNCTWSDKLFGYHINYLQFSSQAMTICAHVVYHKCARQTWVSIATVFCTFNCVTKKTKDIKPQTQKQNCTGQSGLIVPPLLVPWVYTTNLPTSHQAVQIEYDRFLINSTSIIER